MPRMPFGISGLDQDFGGIPHGSFVLLTGEVDSGVDEFAYTSTAMLQMGREDPELFRRYNDRHVEPETVPDEVHFVSLERHEGLVLDKIESVLDARQYDALTRNLNFIDLTDEFLDNMALSLPAKGADKRDKYPEIHEEVAQNVEHPDILEDIEEEVLEYPDILESLAEYLNENATDGIVVIDSLTSLFKMTEFGLDRSDIIAFLTWLTDTSHEWDGLVYAINHTRPTRVRDDPVLASTPDGIMYFSVSDIGGGFHRQMYMGSFRGTLSRSQDRIKVYDTSISGRGFQVSTVNEVI